MATYINGMGMIWPQQPLGKTALLSMAVSSAGERLTCIEPDYAQYLDVRQLRRMSRIIKIGMACGMDALREAGIKIPSGIITGTSYGCLEDTGSFLVKMIENKEHALNPTPFIQSTHNTIGSQLALLLQCQGYNQTYTHGAFSFESALLDAIMTLNDNPNQHVLAGGADEITNSSHAIQKRFGIFRKTSSDNLSLLKQGGEGTLNGEGAAYFLLGGTRGSDSVSLEGVTTIYKPDADHVRNVASVFLKSFSLLPGDVDVVMVGKSGDTSNDLTIDNFVAGLFPTSTLCVFKHLTGEFPTASAIAMALATRIIQAQHIPEIMIEKNAGRPLKTVLIYNPYFASHHSLILLRAC
ncbi:MAG: beta-ketoacyl synthase N-terminal-like domain-containing protein [Chryseolinea sp.]